MFPMKCYIFCSAATGPDQLLDSLLLLTSRQKNATPPIKKRTGMDWVKGIGSKPSYHQTVLVWRTVLVAFNPHPFDELRRITGSLPSGND